MYKNNYEVMVTGMPNKILKNTVIKMTWRLWSRNIMHKERLLILIIRIIINITSLGYILCFVFNLNTKRYAMISFLVKYFSKD
ncbi:hypothetical protein Avbf_11682 [Armadillidium vulgare]|nr:hypothetical protein Avbf_11682 [Armadillidium vulgare]